MNDRTLPCAPSQAGTFPFGGEINATYTVGRDPAIGELRKIMETTDTIAVDIETYGLGRDALDIKCVQIGVSNQWSGHRAVVLDPRDRAQHYALRVALDKAKKIVMHNSPFDAPSLAHNGLLRIEDTYKIVDTLVYARMANPSDFGGNNLLACAARYLGTPGSDSLMTAFKALGLSRSEGYRTFDLDRPVYVMGAAIDALITAQLLPRVREAAHSCLTLMHPFTKYGVTGEEARALVEREQRINQIMLWRSLKGLRTDLEFLDAYRQDNGQRISEAEQELNVAGIRPGHGASLMKWLDERDLIPPRYPRTTKTRAPSSVAKHLEKIDHPVARTFVAHKQLTKVDKDYLAKVVDLADADDRIHPQVNILGADATGRMSYGGPPLQQFPGPARGIILADEGDKLTSIDWSQIEPVVAANVAKDRAVLAGYEDGTSDFYKDVAALAKVDRKTAKVVVLAQMYGEGLYKLSQDLGITEDQAADLRAAVFRAMPKTSQLLRKLRQVGGDHLCVFTLSGRILPVPMGSYEGRRGPMRHKAVNYFVQGSAYDVLADAIIRVDQAGLSEAVYLAMHDELVVSTDAAHDIERIMSTPPQRLVWMSGRTPVLRTDRKDLGDRWAVA